MQWLRRAPLALRRPAPSDELGDYPGIDFLRRRDPARPFFLMLSVSPAASAAGPAALLPGALPAERAAVAADGRLGESRAAGASRLDSPVPRDPEEIDLARRAYYAQLTHIDHEINRVLIAARIRPSGRHGDPLHVRPWRHALRSTTSPSRCRMMARHVPFILRPPGGEACGMRSRGRRSTRSWSCETSSRRSATSPGCRFEGLDGASVLPLLRGEERGWREYLHGEHAAGRGRTTG